MQMSEKCDQVVGAFIKAQSSLKKAAKDTDNPFFKSKYADLNAVWAACQDALCDNDLAAIQDVQTTADGVTVSTRILHSSGQWIECGPLTVPLGAKRDAQGVGSAITYGRRYGLSATLGVVADEDEDDDGNAAASQRPDPKEKIPQTTTGPSVEISENSWTIKTRGYSNKEAAARKWQSTFSELCAQAPDIDTLNAIQSDNMATLEIFQKEGMYDPIQAAIDAAHQRLAPQAAE